MVKRLLFLFFLVPSVLFSGEFKATVNRNQVSLDEQLTLSVTLKDASSKNALSFDSLKKSFSIDSQQQFFNTLMSNGSVNASTTWKLTLTPLFEGDLLIPALNIETTEGILSTQPLHVRVVKPSAVTQSDRSASQDIVLTSDISNAKPYKNEPFIYTIKIISRKNLTNLRMENIELENAIIEMKGEPKIYPQVVEGINLNVIELNYFITPIQAGLLKIPSRLIHGATPVKRKAQRRSFFDDDFDPFSLMQGFDQLKPFALKTEEMMLEIQPPVPEMTPWLPAKSVKIEEIWDDKQTFQVGEPFNRVFKITVEGLKSNQIPSLSDLYKSNNFFKIYADKPELKDEEQNSSIVSYRKEQYTLIPQQSGTLELPEVSILWWDVAKKEKVLTKVPSRAINIIAATENIKMPTAPMQKPSIDSNSEPVLAQTTAQSNYTWWLIGLSIGLALLFITALIWVSVLKNKIRQLKKTPTNLQNVNNKKNSLTLNENPKQGKNVKKEKLNPLNPT
jgi:hypothetical protein